MIVVDASLLIAYLDGSDSHHDSAEALLADAVNDDLGINPLTLAEVLVAPTRTGRLDAVLEVLRDLDVESLPLPVDSAVRLAELRVRTNLRMPDCCVLLAAQDAAASVASCDARLAQAAESLNLRVLTS